MERQIDKLSRPKAVMILAGLSIGYAVVLFGLGPYSEIQRAYQGRKLLEESFGYGKTDVATQPDLSGRFHPFGVPAKCVARTAQSYLKDRIA